MTNTSSMPTPGSSPHPLDPVLRRFQTAGASPDLVRRVEALGTRAEALPAGAMMQARGEPVRRPRYLLSGWACRYGQLSDGRRQIFDLVLPGEGVGVCLRGNFLAHTDTSALTPVRLLDASALLTPDAWEDCPELRTTLEAQANADERRTLDQIMRLGRLTALERVAHLLLDLHTRLAMIGHVEHDCFLLPVTQETLADMTGLSVVHTNRTLQELRRQKLVRIERGQATLLDRAVLAQLAHYGQ